MEKIKQTILNLYAGEGSFKKHIIYLFILLLPAFSSAAFQLVDKENSKDVNTMLLLLGLVFLPFAITMGIAAFGFLLKFINNKFQNIENAFPAFEPSCFKYGFKALPIFFVWCFYTLLLIIVYISVIGVSVYALASNKGGNIAIILAFVAFIILFAMAFLLAMLIISPFVNLVFIKYGKDLQYSGALFNPVTVINYIKYSFKPVFIVALKYALTSLIINLLLYAIVIIGAALFGFCAYFVAGEHALDSVPGMFVLYLLSVIAVWIMSYVSGIISFAYIDNICELYPEIESKQNETVEQDI